MKKVCFCRLQLTNKHKKDAQDRVTLHIIFHFICFVLRSSAVPCHHTTRLPPRHLSHLFETIRTVSQFLLCTIKIERYHDPCQMCRVMCLSQQQQQYQWCPMCLHFSCYDKTAQDNRLLVLFLLCQVVTNRIFLSPLSSYFFVWETRVCAKNNYNNKYNKIMIEVNGKTCQTLMIFGN